MFMRGLVIVVLASFAIPADGAQRTFVSAGVGSDANACTRALPCRGFAAAIQQTDPGGEVVALDTGGYGPLTIEQSVALIAPAGVHAAITALSGNAIEIDAFFDDVIVLRGLYLNGLGGANGVELVYAPRLHVEHCVVSGFEIGIVAATSDPDSVSVFMVDTVVRENQTGLQFFADSLIRVSLDSVRVEQNELTGIEAGNNAVVTATRSVSAGNGGPGFLTSSATGTVNLEQCSVTMNGHGILTNGTARVRNSLITGNVTGVETVIGGDSISFGNNGLHGNGSDGAFSTTVPQQ